MLGEGNDAVDIEAGGRRAILDGGPGSALLGTPGDDFEFPMVVRNLAKIDEFL